MTQILIGPSGGGGVLPEWWGALGDGITDDTAAILLALATTKDVYFTAGKTYIVDGTLLPLVSKQSVFGYGATLKLKPGTYTDRLYFFGSHTNISWDASIPVTEHVRIFGIFLDGNIDEVTVSHSMTGVSIFKGFDWTLEDMNIKDLPGVTGEGYGVIGSMSDTIHMNRCIIDRTDRSNVYVWETTNFTIDNCQFLGNIPPQYQTSTGRITNTKLSNSYITGTHVLRLSGGFDVSLANVEIDGYPGFDGGGTGATATATVSGGGIASITVTNGGSGYLSAPYSYIYGGGGTIPVLETTINSSGEVDAIEVISPGGSYSTAPTVYIGTGNEGIYVVSAAKNRIHGTNVRIDNTYRGIFTETTAPHALEFSNLEIGVRQLCRHGIRGTSASSILKINGGIVRVSGGQPFYSVYAAHNSVKNVTFIGGNAALALYPVEHGTAVFDGNSIIGNTAASYSMLVGGDATAEPIISNNTLVDNTANVIRMIGFGRATGNMPVGCIDTATAITDEITSTGAAPASSPLAPNMTHYDSVSGIVYLSVNMSTWKALN